MTTLRLHAGSPRGRHFNLVEILISLAILIVSLFILMGAIPAAMKNLDKAKANLYAPMAAHITSSWLQMYLNSSVEAPSATLLSYAAYAGKKINNNSFGSWYARKEANACMWAPADGSTSTTPTALYLPAQSAFNPSASGYIPEVAPTIAVGGTWTSDPYCEINDANFTKVYQATQGSTLYRHKTLPSLFKYKGMTLIPNPKNLAQNIVVTDFECGLRLWTEPVASSTMTFLRGHGSTNYVCNYWTDPGTVPYRSSLYMFDWFGDTGGYALSNGWNHFSWRTSPARTMQILVSWPVTMPMNERIARGNFYQVSRLVKGSIIPEITNYNLLFDLDGYTGD